MKKELKEFWMLLTNPIMILIIVLVFGAIYINSEDIKRQEQQIEVQENLNK